MLNGYSDEILASYCKSSGKYFRILLLFSFSIFRCQPSLSRTPRAACTASPQCSHVLFMLLLPILCFYTRSQSCAVLCCGFYTLDHDFRFAASSNQMLDHVRYLLMTALLYQSTSSCRPCVRSVVHVQILGHAVLARSQQLIDRSDAVPSVASDSSSTWRCVNSALYIGASIQ